MAYDNVSPSGPVATASLFSSRSLSLFQSLSLSWCPVYCGPHPTPLRPFPRHIPPTHAHSCSHTPSHTDTHSEKPWHPTTHTHTYPTLLHTHTSFCIVPIAMMCILPPPPPSPLSVWNTLRRPVACERWLGLREEKHNYFSPQLFTQRWQKLVWSMKSQKFLSRRGRQIGINLRLCARVCLQSFHLCSFPIS